MKSVVFAETHAVFGINDVVAVVRLAERLRRRVRRLHSGAVFSFLGAMNRLEAVFTAAASLYGKVRASHEGSEGLVLPKIQEPCRAVFWLIDYECVDSVKVTTAGLAWAPLR